MMHTKDNFPISVSYDDFSWTYPTHVGAFHSIGYLDDYDKLQSFNLYEIVIFRNGQINYHVGNNSYPLQKGDIMFVPSKHPQYGIYNEDRKNFYDMTIIWITPVFLENIKALLTSNLPDYFDFSHEIKLSIPLKEIDEIFCLADKILKYVKSDLPYAQALLYGHTLCLLSKIMEYSKKQPKYQPDYKPALIDQIVTYIEQHYAEKLTLEKVAGTFCISVSGLKKLFKTKRNTSFYQFLTKRRLVNAELLMKQDIPLKEVSREVGFPSYSSFYRAFVKEYGIAPTEYYTSSKS